MGLPTWLSVKRICLPVKAGDTGVAASIPRSGRSLVGGNGNPLQYSCLENSMDRGAWWATYSPWGCKGSDTCVRLSTLSQMAFPGGSVVKSLPAKAGGAGDTGLIPRSGNPPRGRNGNSLQYSCLENLVDRGAWQAKSQT